MNDNVLWHIFIYSRRGTFEELLLVVAILIAPSLYELSLAAPTDTTPVVWHPRSHVTSGLSPTWVLVTQGNKPDAVVLLGNVSWLLESIAYCLLLFNHIWTIMFFDIFLSIAGMGHWGTLACCGSINGPKFIWVNPRSPDWYYFSALAPLGAT